MKYNRVLLKISGETLSGNSNNVFEISSALAVAQDIKNVLDAKIDVSIVVGGGNIVRGRSFLNSEHIMRETADSVGMLSTVINGLLLKNVLSSIGLDAVVVSYLNLPFGIQSANHDAILKYIDEKKIIIFVGGLGIPYFSTDTSATINAILSKCDIILKATKTDGIYDKDPKKYKNSQHIAKITYDEAISANIHIMDQAAFAMAKEHKLPILVFSMHEKNCFFKALNGDIKHSLVSDDMSKIEI